LVIFAGRTIGAQSMLKLLDHLEEWIISILIGAATLIIFAAVVHRYASGYELLFPYTSQLDFSWAQELCIYMFVWMAKFGAAYGVRTGIHVGVDVFVNRLPGPKARRVILFGLLCGALFTGVVGTLGATFVWHMSETEIGRASCRERVCHAGAHPARQRVVD